MFLTFKQQATSTGLDELKDSIVLIRRKDSVFGGNLVRRNKKENYLNYVQSILVNAKLHGWYWKAR
jgi:hypothetical protein